MKLELLVVDDERSQRELLAGHLREHGHTVREAVAAEEALGLLADQPTDLVLTDVRLPGTDGVEMIRRARSRGIDSEFLVMTAFGTIDNAVEAMRAGAYDYLTKPIRLDHLDSALVRVSGVRGDTVDDPFADLGAAMRQVRTLADRVARSEATVLVQGESGVGKEVVARRIHARSRRHDGPFVACNCAALTESLLEAELFGHAAGAFTGATEARPGLFEAARGGTVLLDEIGDVSPAVQVRLLRVLQEREVIRIGEREPRPVDFRLLAATHRDLDAEVRAGRFREDLLYRLRVVELTVPPLRERREDMAPLAARFIQRHAQRHGVEPRPLSDDALAALHVQPFPGNVRELEHRIERGLVLAEGATIGRADLGLTEEPRRVARSLPDAVEQLEREWIGRALDEHDGVRARAARALGIPERVLRYKLRKYGIDAERRK
ncbi:MAG: sigma-54 dependent transcriptional regulator [Planctomycetota bacterium]